MIFEDYTNILDKTTKILKKCDICSKEEYISVESLKKYKQIDMCKSCSTKKRLKGTKLDSQVKHKISVSKKGKPGKKHTEEYKQKITGCGNPFYGKNHSKESIQKSLQTRKDNGIWEINYRIGIANRDNTYLKFLMLGKAPNKPKRSKLVYKNIMFRSSWELKYAKYLDENCVSWKYEPFCLSIGKNVGYTPDFLVNETEIHEVKGGYWTTDGKFQIAKNLYPKFKFILLTKNELKDLKVL